MDTKTLIENDIFNNKDELKNWLRFMENSRTHNNRDLSARYKVRDKDMPHYEKILGVLDEKGYKTFKVKHLKGNVMNKGLRHDDLQEYSPKTIGYYLHKMIKCGLLKVRMSYSNNRSTTYEKNYENIDDAIEVLYEQIK